MTYVKIYLELKLDLIAAIAKMETLERKLKLLNENNENSERCKKELEMSFTLVEHDKKRLNQLEMELRENIALLNNVELRVFVLRNICGYTLRHISEELCYSIGRIKQIASVINAKLK
jgi:DNA-directed RNA polymerase specialized sigma24 family protein